MFRYRERLVLILVFRGKNRVFKLTNRYNVANLMENSRHVLHDTNAI